ncbi:Uncharacterised protein [Citrobacter koseri]|nr:Uncharacterised protein [Citrobacter koseri]
MPSHHHRQRGVLIERRHRPDFIFRQQARFKRQAQFSGNGRCRAWVIAGQITPFTPN